MKILSIPNENGKMTCFWEEGASSGKKPLIICLADKEEDAQRDLNLLFSQANGASVAALVIYDRNSFRSGLGLASWKPFSTVVRGNLRCWRLWRSL